MVEIYAPSGYVLPEGEWELTFNDEDVESLVAINDKVTMSVQGINNPLAMSYIDDTIYIYNEESFDIPTTGGIGTIDLIKISVSIIVVGFVLVIYYRKKKNK